MSKKRDILITAFILFFSLCITVSCSKNEHKESGNELGAKQSFDKGKAYYKLGKIDDAIREFENTVLYNRKHKMAHYNLGVLYKEKGRNSEAAHEFEEYLKYETDTDERTEEVKNYVRSEIEKLRGK